MRESSDQRKIKALMKTVGERISQPLQVYFTGGATAVLLGTRASTLDVDLKFEPELDEMYWAIRELKETLNINIELAAPDHFIPPLPGWKERSLFIETVGKVSYYHYDLYSQVLAKIERGWELDLQDAKNFVKHSVDMGQLTELFFKIKEDFIRYPGVEPQRLEEKLTRFRHETTR